ncbi:hypothetical protein [Candidatus Lokiarchaeum ossiferum]|uniref:hypothetical protein n=1 Tax=Candidatus Lokiarchaeum ossiferum TaxID=2951803 RepID=UPI00352DA8E4
MQLTEEQLEIEKNLASKHYAIRFCYYQNLLIGFDFRERGACWNYPKFLDGLTKEMNEKSIFRYYYGGSLNE